MTIGEENEEELRAASAQILAEADERIDSLVSLIRNTKKGGAEDVVLFAVLATRAGDHFAEGGVAPQHLAAAALLRLAKLPAEGASGPR